VYCRFGIGSFSVCCLGKSHEAGKKLILSDLVPWVEDFPAQGFLSLLIPDNVETSLNILYNSVVFWHL
jgi:hypothetical protein